jgi:hypothetical protein
VTDNYKYSSLLRHEINHVRKKFYITGPLGVIVINIIKQVALNISSLLWWLVYKTHKHYNQIKKEIIYKSNLKAKQRGLGLIDREPN